MTTQERIGSKMMIYMVGVALIEEKLVQHRQRWFRHIQRRPPEVSVQSGRIKRVDDVKRGRDRPNLTWEEFVKRLEGLEYHQITSHGHLCMQVSYPGARTITRFRDLMGFNSSLSQLVWD